jgi:hypothetical protein
VNADTAPVFGRIAGANAAKAAKSESQSKRLAGT